MQAADIPGVIALSARAFPGQPPWTDSELRSHLRAFPEGQLVAIDPATGKVVGSASSLILRWHTYPYFADWDTLTGEGTFDTHDPLGHTLYGAHVGVDPACQGRGVGAALYEARRALARRLNLRRIVAGGRIPGFAEASERLSPEAYVALVVAKLHKDAVLSFQLAQGFRVLAVIPRYLRYDSASKGFATLLEWRNPAYREEVPSVLAA